MASIVIPGISWASIPITLFVSGTITAADAIRRKIVEKDTIDMVEKAQSKYYEDLGKKLLKSRGIN